MTTNKYEQHMSNLCADLARVKNLYPEERPDALQEIGDALFDLAGDIWQMAEVAKEMLDVESAEEDYRKTELLALKN